MTTAVHSTSTIPTLDWYGCYSEGWKGVIVDDAFTHPAKFGRALIRKIYGHILEQGYIKRGDSIIDPFGGVALGSYEALYQGLNWTGVELEPKFVELGNRNIAKFNKDLGFLYGDLGTAVLLNGDSRNLATIVQSAKAAISSPPFGEASSGGGLANPDSVHQDTGQKFGKNHGYQNQGVTDGNLATLKASELDFQAAVSSPPYVDCVKNGDGTGVRFDHNGRLPEKGHNNSSQSNYGDCDENLGNMSSGDFEAVVGSPPFEGVLSRDNSLSTDRKKLAKELGITNTANVSPIELERVGKRSQPDYGKTKGQLGNDSGETFWNASRQILEQVYTVLAPNSYAVWVCKDFVRKGQRVPFSDQWLQLCTAVGFEPVERVRAWVVEEKGTQLDIFGNSHTKTIDRKSFFRRLAEKKGSPRIDWEDVLIVRKGAS